MEIYINGVYINRDLENHTKIRKKIEPHNTL